MNITEKRRVNMLKAQKSAAKSNNLKGLNTFILSHNKQTKLKNEVIKNLIESGLYNDMYNRFVESNDDLSNLNDKEIDILTLVDFCEPDDLEDHFEGLRVVETKLF